MNELLSPPANGARERNPVRRLACKVRSYSFTQARRRVALLAGVAFIAGCASTQQDARTNAERIDTLEQTQAAVVSRVGAVEAKVAVNAQAGFGNVQIGDVDFNVPTALSGSAVATLVYFALRYFGIRPSTPRERQAAQQTRHTP